MVGGKGNGSGGGEVLIDLDGTVVPCKILGRGQRRGRQGEWEPEEGRFELSKM